MSDITKESLEELGFEVSRDYERHLVLERYIKDWGYLEVYFMLEVSSGIKKWVFAGITLMSITIYDTYFIDDIRTFYKRLTGESLTNEN